MKTFKSVCNMTVAFLPVLGLAVSAHAFGGGSSVGPANPAAKFCLAAGGALENIETANGQDANCVIEEWSLFRLAPAHLTGSAQLANPAAVYCGSIGGHLRMVETSAGQGGYCVILQWDLFRAMHSVQ